MERELPGLEIAADFMETLQIAIETDLEPEYEILKKRGLFLPEDKMRAELDKRLATDESTRLIVTQEMNHLVFRADMLLRAIEGGGTGTEKSAHELLM